MSAAAEPTPARAYRRLRYTWTPERDEIIREAYRKMRCYNDRKATTRAATRLQIHRWNVLQRGQQLGLAQTKERSWTDEEEQLLEQWGHLSPETISDKLRVAGFKRSPVAVLLKRKRLRIMQNLGGYSASALADAFGIDSHKVMRWLHSGMLRGERRGSARTEQQGGDTWWITRDDVKHFVLKFPDEVDLCKVEKFWFLDLLTDGRICR